VGADGAEGRGEVVVVDGCIELRVEPGDEGVVRVEPLGALEVGLRELVGQGGEGRGIRSRCGETGGGLFERTTNFEQLADVARVDVAHDGDARRLLHDEPVGGEPAERFAEGRAADAEARRLLDLAEHRAGCQRARLDLVEERRVRAITCPHACTSSLASIRASVYIRAPRTSNFST